MSSTGRYLSGSAKRKKKALLLDEVKKMKGTMSKFLSNPSSASSTCDVEKMTIDDNETISPSKTVDYEEAAVKEQEVAMKEQEVVAVKEQDKINFPSNDPALWATENLEEIREHFCRNKPKQNIDLLKNSTRKIGEKERKLSENHFYRKKQNNESVCRDWLIYSESKCALFCFVCKLFSTSDQALCNQGYTDWKNVSQRLSEHECSKIHREAVCLFSSRVNAASRIDYSLVEEYETECKYWQNVLRRVVAVIKFLCKNGLPMFGSDETLKSAHNGNFLSCLELVSYFDPFIADHLAKHGNSGKGKTNYLSSTIVNELICVMGDCVLKKILREIEHAKYFGIIVDSTPDLTHVDQLSIVIRYVDEYGQPVERFIKFEPLRNHLSSTLCETILNSFATVKIDIKNCRGQSFDNASNMAGKYSGLQARIKELNPLAQYVPCSAHSLNLVISVAVECCPQVISFFGFLQNLYNFFSASTHRWEILISSLDIQGGRGLTLKSLSGTRWSACAAATKALRKGYICITNALKKICNDSEEKNSTRHEARALISKMEKLETAILTVIWDTVLQRTDKVSKTLQGPKCSFSVLVPLYDSLIIFIQDVRNNFDIYESEACELVGNQVTYKQSRKKRTPKSRMLDESENEEVTFDERKSFIYQCHYVMCDSLLCELSKRKEVYSNMELKFGFLYQECNETTKDKIYNAAKELQKEYFEDLDTDFPEEFLQFKNILPGSCDPELELQTLKKLNIEHTFPNVDICLRILLSMPISNSSSERSFSALKRIKKFLRSNLNQYKLSNLILLCVEYDITSKLDFEDVIKVFAEKKSRKKPL